MDDRELELAGRLAAQLRVDSIRCSTEARSGHPTSSLSAADLMAVLAGHLRYDWDRPDLAANDHLIFSKGHASPLLYAMFRAAGVIGEAELVKTYRQFGARLQGHPTPVLPWVDVATGSLGQGLPDAVGVCLAGRYLDRLPYHAWVLCGDSETAEGSIWEALDKASYYRLGNLTAIVDVNRLGQRSRADRPAHPHRAPAGRLARDHAFLQRAGHLAWLRARGEGGDQERLRCCRRGSSRPPRRGRARRRGR